MNKRTQYIFMILIFLLSACSNKFFIQNNKPRDHEEISIIKGIKAEKQTDQFACGIASLVSIMNYWDIKIKQTKILKRFPLESEHQGYSIAELKQIAKNYGVDAFVLKGNIDFLKEQILLGRPLIVPIWMSDSWQFLINGVKIWGGAYNHYVVAYGFSQNYIYVMDPDKGIKTIHARKFLKMWEVNKNLTLLIAKKEG